MVGMASRRRREGDVKRAGGVRFAVVTLGGSEFAVWSTPTASIEGLTPAEGEVVAALVRGSSYRAIAADRGVSRHTVAHQAGSALRKLGLTSRAELIAWLAPPGSAARVRRG